MSDDVTWRSVGGPPFDRLANIWLSTTEHTLDSVLAANRAAMAAAGLTDGSGRRPGGESLAYRDPDWSTETDLTDPETVSIGDRVVFRKRVTDEDIELFAAISGDTNRLHLDAAYAQETRFGGRIVHGSFVAALISAALARLPGLTVYLSQDTTFLKPVEIGDELSAECEVIEDLGDERYRLRTSVYTQDDVQVIDGEAVVLIDPTPEPDE